PSASFIADRYALGDRATLTGPVARGELGQVWRLITSNGTWAVKEPFEPKSEAESREEAEIQGIAREAGIPAPGVIRSADGNVSLVVGDVRICVFEWVDVLERDPGLDPVSVGQVVASIHRVPFPEIRGEDPWYREPITNDRWRELSDHLEAARRRSRTNSRLTAPNWRRSERSSSRPQCSRPAIGTSGRTTSARPLTEGSAFGLGELRARRPEPGAVSGVVRVRCRRGRTCTRYLPGLRRDRRPGSRDRSPHVLDADFPARAHRRGGMQAVAHGQCLKPREGARGDMGRRVPRTPTEQ